METKYYDLVKKHMEYSFYIYKQNLLGGLVVFVLIILGTLPSVCSALSLALCLTSMIIGSLGQATLNLIDSDENGSSEERCKTEYSFGIYQHYLLLFSMVFLIFAYLGR